MAKDLSTATELSPKLVNGGFFCQIHRIHQLHLATPMAQVGTGLTLLGVTIWMYQ